MIKKKTIPTLVKDPHLVEKRRAQIVRAAVGLFIERGFHKTTTREIARASGMSIGSLYEYFKCKEDVLYLVCDTIHNAVQERLEGSLQEDGSGKDAIVRAIHGYFQVCDEMADMILLIYQESKSLPADSLRYVLENEERITRMFRNLLERSVESGALRIRDGGTLSLLAHDITVLGHMWTFRRWSLQHAFRLEEYTRIQTELILKFVE